jgi:hypothetical protein
MSILVGALVFLVVLALILSGKLRTLVKGFFGIFVEDLAKTPEGANAVYNQAIEKEQEKYNIANDTLMRIAGQLDTAKKNYESTLQKVKSIEEKCEKLAQAGKFDQLDILAKERSELLEDIESLSRLVSELTPMYEEAKLINNKLEENLNKLKKDRKRVINEMKINSQLKDMYDDMNELKNTTDVSKLLDVVKDGAREKREMAVGAKVIHNNKLSTKIEKAHKEAKDLQTDEFVESLKKKYNK